MFGVDSTLLKMITFCLASFIGGMENCYWKFENHPFFDTYTQYVEMCLNVKRAEWYQSWHRIDDKHM